MKREGKQHGTVRTFCILPTSPINQNRPVLRKASPTLGSPPTAGIFTRVPTKPTNHSKFTGKCGRARCSDCHLHPSWKSKDKIKGARTKLRSTSGLDVGHGGLIEWRVMAKYDDESWAYDKLMLDSQSASDILYELRTDDLDDEFDFYSSGYIGNRNNPYIYKRNRMYGNRNRNRNRNRAVDDEEVEDCSLNLDSLIEYPFISTAIHQVSNEIHEEEDEDEIKATGFDEIFVVEDEDLGFYDVAIMWDPIDGDEGWSLIDQT
ncbi:hypothetical protein V2J09_002583 [Rumex salicifolius]